MKTLPKRLKDDRTRFFNAGVDAGVQKACDLMMVAAYECGFVRTPAKARQWFQKFTELEQEYGIAWQSKAESDEVQERIDYVLKKLCGEYFQPFAERNDLIQDWWETQTHGTM